MDDSKLTTLLGPPEGYVDILLNNMEKRNREDHAAGRGFQKTPIRPSSAGNCARELYLQLREFTGREKFPYVEKTGETILLLDLGHAIESHLIRKIRTDFKTAEVRYTQQVLDFGHIEAVNDKALSQHLEGSLDLCLFSDKYKVCIDVKSKGDRHDFRARKTAWESTTDKLTNMKSVARLTDRAFWVDDLEAFLAELGDPFFEANFKQLNMYLNSQFLKDRGVDHGAIIQYHKNKSLLREIRFRPSTKVYNETVQKLRGVIRAVDEDKPELAPAEYQPESFKSRYCNYCRAKAPGSCAMVNKKPKEGIK